MSKHNVEGSFYGNLKVKNVDDGTNNGDDSLIISGYASTYDLDRDGDIVSPKSWDDAVRNYKKNPILLYNHDRSKPIGKIIDISYDDKGLYVEAEVYKSVNGEVYELINKGVLKTFSISFSLKDFKYDRVSGAFVITEFDLHEISVVSVPANPEAIFDIKSKMMEIIMTDKDKQKNANAINNDNNAGLNGGNNSGNGNAAPATGAIGGEQISGNSPADSIGKGANNDSDKNADSGSLDNTNNQHKGQYNPPAFDVTDYQKFFEELRKEFENSKTAFQEEISRLKSELKEKASAIDNIAQSKMVFNPEGTKISEHESFVRKAVLLSVCTGKAIQDLNFVKAAPHLSNMTGNWEQEFSESIMRDIRQRLVIEPLFTRRVEMNAATMNIAVNPEVGYGEWIANTYPPLRNDPASTGTAVDHKLRDIILVAYKVVSKEYYGYEEEEDAIIPLLGIIEEAIIRRIAKSVDKALLLGSGASANDPITGINTRAISAGKTVDLSIGNNDVVTVDSIIAARRKLGVYGLNQSDIRILVSQEAYYDLLEDQKFQTIDKVGSEATLLTGQIGSIGGSPVIVSGEFNPKTDGEPAVTLVTPNLFLFGELRGVTVGRASSLEGQYRVIVGSRRIAFNGLVDGEGAVTIRWIA